MRVKEVTRCALAAWSPCSVSQHLLACAPAERQQDVTAAPPTTALELFSLHLHEPQVTLKAPTASVSTPARFHSLCWGGGGNGVIAAGAGHGVLLMYSVDNLLAGGADSPLVHKASNHSGAVSSLDFNPFQSNLLASGASQSELFIWDLNKPTVPFSPGAKCQPPEPVSCVAWNCGVQHILASTLASRAVVWDLRKNEPIVKLTDSQTGMRCSVLTWHPEVSTQLLLASDQDATPSLQLWDLRSLSAPIRCLRRHNKGVMSLSWNKRDSHLLLSAGRDDRILCWDPNSDTVDGEVVAEISASFQCNYQVAWCPRSPNLVVGCSLDSVGVYNVMGAAEEPVAAPPAELVDSFPNMAGLADSLPSVQRRVSVPLARPPSWLKRPCGASFAFGGKLVSFGVDVIPADSAAAEASGPHDQASRAVVIIHSVTTDRALVQRSLLFQEVLRSGQFERHCQQQLARHPVRQHQQLHRQESSCAPTQPQQSEDSDEQEEDSRVWLFLSARLQALQEPDNRRLLALLGHAGSPNQSEEQVNDLASDARVDDDGSGEDEAGPVGDDVSDSVLAAEPEEMFDIPTGDDVDGQVCLSLIRGDFHSAVDHCVKGERMADALLIALSSPSHNLFLQTRDKYLDSMKTDVSLLIAALVSGEWRPVVRKCDPGSWTEALAAILTHAPPQQLPALCSELGSRLQSQHTRAMWTAAQLCYVCAGDTDRLVQCWQKTRRRTSSPLMLQELIEQCLTLEHVNSMGGSVRRVAAAPPAAGDAGRGLASRMVHYCYSLTSQSCLEPALQYLAQIPEHPEAESLRQRINVALSAGRPQSAASYGATGASYGATGASYGATGTSYGATGAAARHVSGSNVSSTLCSAPPSMVQRSRSPSGTMVPGVFVPSQSVMNTANIGVAGQAAAPLSVMTTPLQPVSVPPLLLSPPLPQISPMTPGMTAGAAHGAGGGGGGGGGLLASRSSLSSRRHYVPDPSTATVPHGYSGGFPSAPGMSFAMPPTPPMAGPNNVATLAQTVQSSGSSLSPPRTSSGPAWNDPPPLRTSRKTVTTTASFLHGVSQPIYDPAQPQANSPFCPSMPVARADPGAVSSGGGAVSPLARSISGDHAPESADLSSAHQQQQTPQQASKTICGEDAVLYDRFDGLLKECVPADKSLRYRRRLDEIGTKLRLLYDMLTDHNVPPNTLAGLHQIAECASRHDFSAALAALQRTVAQSNIDAISRYMPAVKSLLQTASQLLG